MNLTQSYPTLKIVYEKYRLPLRTIRVEGNVYHFMHTIKLDAMSKHIYRCEREQHTLSIHVLDGKVFYVDGEYSIQGVS